MSSLPRRKKNRGTDGPAKKLYSPFTNVPVGKEESESVIRSAKEVHQHQTIPHVVMCVRDDESYDVVCLFCGGQAQIKKPYAAAVDNDVFGFFKQFHSGCEAPEKPVGFFNVDMSVEDKKNPLYVNSGSGVTVELREIRTDRSTNAENYFFADVTSPEVILSMPKEEFEKFFVRKED